MRLLVWALRFIVFLALFALALNNQHAVTLHSFFGIEWQTRMIYVVLAAFIAGCAIGVLAMMPRWWRGKRTTTTATPTSSIAAASAVAPQTPSPPPSMPDHPSSQFGAEAALPPQERY
jgi:lipopolysaccharide assembly protein A